MKKIFSIIAMIALTLTLTGCGSKELEVTCTKNDEKIVINYKNNKIVKQYTEVTQKYANEDLFNMAYQATQMTVSAYNAMDGITAELTKNDKSLTLKVTFDVAKMSKETLEETELDEKPNDLIKDAKEEGYTCTTK